MAITHSKTGASTGASTQAEGKAEAEMQQHLTEAFDELDQLKTRLIDLRKPVNKCTKDIEQVYAVLEKRGYDRKVAKFLYDQHRAKKRFTPEFKITANAYLKALGEQTDLFDMKEPQRH